MTITSKIDLWNRIADFEMDDKASSFSFTKRLARDNSWRLSFADRVVEEYKRFMFLAVCADHPVTPSDHVDQAWHLHMIYTRSYWEEFCGGVLQVPVHHGPTKGGGNEREKFVDWYAKTLESYRVHFGEEPPDDIWPASDIRFGRDIHYKRINTELNWVIRKPRLEYLFDVRNLAYVVAASAPVSLVAWSPFDLGGKAFLLFYALLALAFGSIIAVLRLIVRSDGTAKWEQLKQKGRLPTSQLAYLAGGEKRLLQVAVCELLTGQYAKSFRQTLERHPSAPAIGTKTGSRLSKVAQLIFEKLQTNNSIRFGEIKETARLGVARVNGDLVSAGLVQPRSWWLTMVWFAALATIGILALGVARIVQALDGGHPFGYLMFEMIVIMFAGWGLAITTPFRTKAGSRFYKEERQNRLKRELTVSTNDMSLQEVVSAVAFFGTGELLNTNWQQFEKEIDQVVQSIIHPGSGSGSGSFGGDDSGCGGAGCGGGCGGCGGCGD